MGKYHLGSASFGIAIKQELPDNLRELLEPADEKDGLEFHIYPNGMLMISSLQRGITLCDGGPEARQILVRIQGSDTFWVLESTVAGHSAARVEYHKAQVSEIKAVINTLRPCKSYQEFHIKARVTCGNWVENTYLRMPRTNFIFDGRQLNYLSSEAKVEKDLGNLEKEIQMLLKGEEIDARLFHQLLARKGLWFLLGPSRYTILTKVAASVGLHAAHAVGGEDISGTGLLLLAKHLVNALMEERTPE
jgi:hypothetical protein